MSDNSRPMPGPGPGGEPTTHGYVVQCLTPITKHLIKLQYIELQKYYQIYTFYSVPML